MKNIIPAIASTNALVSAVCVNEALKLATNIAGSLQNYMMYMGDDGLYAHTFEYAKKEECPACGTKPFAIKVPATTELKAFVDILREDSRFQLKVCHSASATGRIICITAPCHISTLTRIHHISRILEPLNPLQRQERADAESASAEGAHQAQPRQAAQGPLPCMYR